MSQLYAHFQRITANRKTGPIPVTMTHQSTCPPDCAISNLCYAKFGPLYFNWMGLNDEVRRRGSVQRITWDELCDQIRKLPHQQMWRHNAAGDLPGIGNAIDPALFDRLVQANKNKRGWTYTHKPVGFHGQSLINAQAIFAANKQGFVVNVSTESLERADELIDMKIGPVVAAVPTDTPKVIRTPAGRKGIVCPAETVGVTCDCCQLCLKVERSSIILFRAHGPKWVVKRANAHLKVLQGAQA